MNIITTNQWFLQQKRLERSEQKAIGCFHSYFVRCIGPDNSASFGDESMNLCYMSLFVASKNKYDSLMCWCCWRLHKIFESQKYKYVRLHAWAIGIHVMKTNLFDDDYIFIFIDLKILPSVQTLLDWLLKLLAKTSQLPSKCLYLNYIRCFSMSHSKYIQSNSTTGTKRFEKEEIRL